MPDIVDMLQALPHAVTPGPAGPDPAATSPLMTLAARITASESSRPGNASLEIVKNIIGGKLMQVYYGLYTDSGKLYSGDDKQTLMVAVAQHANQADGADFRAVAAARYAAAGDLATARVRMVNATPNDFFLSLAARKKIWAAGDPEIRAGVLRLLSTIPEVTVANSTTDGQPTLTITAGPAVFGGAGDEVLIINATTGLPVSSVSTTPGVPAGVETYRVARVTLASIEAGKF